MARYILNIDEVLEFLDSQQEVLRDLGFSKSSIVVRAFGPMLLALQKEKSGDFPRLRASRMFSSYGDPVSEITANINRHFEQMPGRGLRVVRSSGPEVGRILRIISDTSVLLGEAVMQQLGTLPPYAVAHVVLPSGLIVTT